MPHDPYDDAKLPPPVREQAFALLAEAQDNPQKCGRSFIFAKFWLESHTLGCRYEAGQEGEAAWSCHWTIHDEYFNDGKSFIVGAAEDGAFVTVTPQRKSLR